MFFGKPFPIVVFESRINRRARVVARNVRPLTPHVSACRPVVSRRSVDAGGAMRRWGVLMLLLVALEGGPATEHTDDSGLSRGDANPAELGTRCAVLAGRDDRAYLDCGMQAPRPTPSSDATLNDRLRIDPSGGGHESAGRRYPVRSR